MYESNYGTHTPRPAGAGGPQPGHTCMPSRTVLPHLTRGVCVPTAPPPLGGTEGEPNAAQVRRRRGRRRSPVGAGSCCRCRCRGVGGNFARRRSNSGLPCLGNPARIRCSSSGRRGRTGSALQKPRRRGPLGGWSTACCCRLPTLASPARRRERPPPTHSRLNDRDCCCFSDGARLPN